VKAKKRRELTETRAIFTINSTREPNLVDKCMQLHQHQQGSLIAARFSGKMCPDYKYILMMHPPFATSLLPMAILQINNRTFVNAKNVFFCNKL